MDHASEVVDDVFFQMDLEAVILGPLIEFLRSGSRSQNLVGEGLDCGVGLGNIPVHPDVRAGVVGDPFWRLLIRRREGQNAQQARSRLLEVNMQPKFRIVCVGRQAKRAADAF